MMKRVSKRYICPCCGCFTLPKRGEYDVCPVCFWEDDPGQFACEQSCEGANGVSLLEARKNYAAFGACETEMLPYVRKPLPNELPDDTAPDDSCRISDTEYLDLIKDLNQTLSDLSVKYVNGPNCVVWIFFKDIVRPDPSDIAGPLDPARDAVETFIKETLGADVGSIPSDAYRLWGVFSASVWERLELFDPSVYALSEAGRKKYKALLKPFVCLGMIAVSIGNKWLILCGEWSD